MRSSVVRLTAALCMASTALSPVAAVPMERPAPVYAGATAVPSVLAYGDDEPGQKRKKKSNVGKIAICGVAILAGILLGGNKGLAIGIAACAVTWAIAGLTKKDNEALSDRTTQMMDDDGGSHSTAWQAPESKKNLQIEVGEAQPTQARVEFAVDDGVQAPQAGTRLNAKPYIVAVQRLNFRTEPSASSPDTIRGYFEKGEVVQVIGLSPDGNWALVGDDGVVVGYASLSAGGVEALASPERYNQLTRPAPSKRRGAKPPPASRIAVNRATPRAKPRLLMTASSTMGTFRNADTAKVKTTKVAATTYCKSAQVSDGARPVNKTGCLKSNGTYGMT